MSMLLFNDPFDYAVRPSRILDQHFGLGLEPEDILAPIIPRELRSFLRGPGGYYRPWRSLVSQQDSGSTVSFDKDQFQANLDVQQFRPEEISVKVTGDNTVTVEGKHEEKQDDHGYISRRFVRKYVLPKGHDINKIESKLSSDGVLTITAPKVDSATVEHRNVPITQTGQPSKPAVENKTEEKQEKIAVENKTEEKQKKIGVENKTEEKQEKIVLEYKTELKEEKKAVENKTEEKQEKKPVENKTEKKLEKKAK